MWMDVDNIFKIHINSKGLILLEPCGQSYLTIDIFSLSNVVLNSISNFLAYQHYYYSITTLGNKPPKQFKGNQQGRRSLASRYLNLCGESGGV